MRREGQILKDGVYVYLLNNVIRKDENHSFSKIINNLINN
jgi:predicted CopG family antitoxin